MDGRITDSYTWKPDQMQIFNPILILTLLPIFEGIIFPLLDKFKIPFKALARLTTGMVCAGLAFVLAAIIQTQLDVSIAYDINGDENASVSEHITSSTDRKYCRNPHLQFRPVLHAIGRTLQRKRFHESLQRCTVPRTLRCEPVICEISRTLMNCWNNRS